MGSEKMSKSLGNVKLIHDLLKDWDGEVIRLALLNAHYRNELIWSEKLLVESKDHLDKWYRILLRWKFNKITKNEPYDIFLKSMSRDLNYVSGVKLIHQAQSSLALGFRPFESIMRAAGATSEKVMRGLKGSDLQDELSRLVSCYSLLGLLQKDPEAWFKGGASSDEEAEFDAIALRRQEARAAKDWAGQTARAGVRLRTRHSLSFVHLLSFCHPAQNAQRCRWGDQAARAAPAR